MNTPSLRRTSFGAAALCFASLAAASGPAANIRSYAGVDSTLALDGVTCGQVTSWQGGEIVGDVALDSTVGGTQKKHISAVHYAPITVDLGLPLATPVVSWINDFLSNKSSAKTVTLASFQADRKTVADAIKATNASLLEVDFPTAEAGSKNRAHLTLVLVAENVQSIDTAPAAGPAGGGKAALEANFRFALDGSSSGKDVASVTGLVVKRHLSNNAVGATRDIDLVAQPADFSNPVVTLAESKAGDWFDWAENFLVKGNSSDSHEKNGSLDFTDASGKAVFSLKFSHFGIVRLKAAATDAQSDRIRHVQAELYFEGLTVSTDDKGDKTEANDSKNAGDKDTNKSDATGSTDSKTVDAAGTANAGDDQGVRDPTDVPRIAGLTRTAFTSTRGPTTSEESATYSSKSPSSEVAPAYDPAFKAAGWEPALRNESGDPASGTHQYRLRWTRKSDAADVRLTDTKSGSNVSVTVTSNRAGSLPGINAKTKTPAIAEKGLPADQGARDPADFPRPAGSTRKSYTALGSASAPQEMATYSAKVPINQIEAFYVKALASGDWDETFRRELGDPASATHQITLKWSKGSRSTSIVLTETSAEVTQIELSFITAAH